MALKLADFIRNTTESLKPLHVAYTQAMWESATSGTEVANESEKSTQSELMRFWADETRFEQAKGFHKDGTASDERTARLIKRIYLAAAKAQQDENSIVARCVRFDHRHRGRRHRPGGRPTTARRGQPHHRQPSSTAV